MLNLLNKTTFIVCFTLLLFVIQNGLSQSINHDIALLEQSHKYTASLQKKSEKLKWIKAINPLFWIYKGGIGFYQKNISVQIAANCVFETTCSRFSEKLVKEFGVIGGTILSIERLSRCNRVTIVESSPLELNEEGKIIEKIEDYHIH